jgi:hypothetical protein
MVNQSPVKNCKELLVKDKSIATWWRQENVINSEIGHASWAMEWMRVAGCSL